VDSEVTFPDGLIGIVGSNGSGKTTVVEAIGFALYGSKALRGRVEDLRSRSVSKSEGKLKQDREPKVTLILEHDGIFFRIERSMSDAKLYLGGESEPLAVGNRDVTVKVSSLVGMNYDEFVATYCTEQKGLEFLSGKKGATERERFIVRMMGYDRIEEMQELVRADRKEKRAVQAGFEASIGSREEIEHRLAKESTELNAFREKHADAVKTLQRADHEFGIVRGRLTKLEEIKARVNREKEAIRTFEVRSEERDKRSVVVRESIAAVHLALAKQNGGNRTAGDLETMDDLESNETNLTTQRDQLVQHHRSLLEEVRDRELAWREQVARAEAAVLAVDHRLADISKRQAKIESLPESGECPTCGQSLEGSKEHVFQHFADERAELDQSREQLKNGLSHILKPPKELESNRDQVSKVGEQLEQIRTQLSELSHVRQALQRIHDYEQELRAIESDKGSIQEGLKRAQNRLSELKFSEDEFNREKGAFDAAQRLLELSRLQRVRLEGDVNTCEALVNRSRLELEKFDERVVSLEQVRKEVRILDECDRILTEFRKQVNSSIRPRLAELASEYLADLTDGRYTSVDLGEDFTPTVLDDGDAKPVISGGEEDILNLCMRIALSHMLAERAGQHFSLLMLDEIFGSLDEGRRSNVITLLEKLRRHFDQIIIITHLDDVKEGVQHLIQVEYDEGTGAANVVQRREEVEMGLAGNF